jgi:hypothetical protein
LGVGFSTNKVYLEGKPPTTFHLLKIKVVINICTFKEANERACSKGKVVHAQQK